MFLVRGTTVATGASSVRGAALSGDEGNVERIARSLFTDFIWPFEITSVLLVIAVVGAIVLVRETRASGRPGDEAEQAEEQSEQAEEQAEVTT